MLGGQREAAPHLVLQQRAHADRRLPLDGRGASRAVDGPRTGRHAWRRRVGPNGAGPLRAPAPAPLVLRPHREAVGGGRLQVADDRRAGRVGQDLFLPQPRVRPLAGPLLELRGADHEDLVAHHPPSSIQGRGVPVQRQGRWRCRRGMSALLAQTRRCQRCGRYCRQSDHHERLGRGRKPGTVFRRDRKRVLHCSQKRRQHSSWRCAKHNIQRHGDCWVWQRRCCDDDPALHGIAPVLHHGLPGQLQRLGGRPGRQARDARRCRRDGSGLDQR
mmetsp:Transcript_96843/g.278102  ORF Transcript_96843/g.278102 Transcript_96843/m.278102 type:complete len:273 (+) Transcript_96843:862-1680(+)